LINSMAAEREHKLLLQGKSVAVRKAAMRDIPALLDLIDGYAAQGVMLPRTEFELSENIRDFCVAVSGEQLVGCGALHFYSPLTAEVRSLAVDPRVKSNGIGRLIVRFLINEAMEYSIAGVFAFTYVAEFFSRLGFHEVERGVLPLKVWKDCLRCPKFQGCDEIAVLRILNKDRWNSVTMPQIDTSLLVQLPTIKR
jgi:amino-acid N-acetyltransferase